MRVRWRLISKIMPIKLKCIRGLIFLFLGRLGLFLRGHYLDKLEVTIMLKKVF